MLTINIYINQWRSYGAVIIFLTNLCYGAGKKYVKTDNIAKRSTIDKLFEERRKLLLIFIFYYCLVSTSLHKYKIRGIYFIDRRLNMYIILL